MTNLSPERCAKCGRTWQPAPGEQAKTCPGCGAVTAGYYEPRMQTTPRLAQARAVRDADDEPSGGDGGDGTSSTMVLTVAIVVVLGLLFGTAVVGGLFWVGARAPMAAPPMAAAPVAV